MEATIYHLPGKEAHMLGDYVGVVWNTKLKKKTLRGEDGLTNCAKVLQFFCQERSGHFYFAAKKSLRCECPDSLDKNQANATWRLFVMGCQ